MLIKTVVLFLLFIAVMGMIQKVLRPGRPKLSAMDRMRCPTCKRVNGSRTPAPCARQDCRYR
ncbi:hypothetical protein [Pararhodobacter sp.]